MVHFHDTYGYGEFDPSHPIGPGAWPHFDLLWIHSGRVAIRLLGQDDLELRGGEGVLICPHTPFAGQTIATVSRASAQHFSVTAGGASCLEPFRRLMGRTGQYDCFRPINAVRIESEIDRALAWTPPPANVATDAPAPAPADSITHALRVAQLAIVLGGLAQSEQPDQRVDAARFDPLVTWLQTRLDDPPTLADMADHLELSVSHFRSRFRLHMGVSPGAYLLQLRMREACRMLRETNTPIKAIARRVGYRDLPNFYRTFHAALGDTPATYRARHALRG